MEKKEITREDFIALKKKFDEAAIPVMPIIIIDIRYMKRMTRRAIKKRKYSFGWKPQSTRWPQPSFRVK